MEIVKAKKHSGSIFDERYPSWWPSDKYPLKYVSEAERSVVPEYLFFWDLQSHQWSDRNSDCPEWFDESEDPKLSWRWMQPVLSTNIIKFTMTQQVVTVKWGPKSKALSYQKLPLTAIPNHEYDEKDRKHQIACR
ncbi:hypothetical protein OK016_18215 [Vibrio chagasii]|nr:hypothetical protein [Vibrio chagasii]